MKQLFVTIVFAVAIGFILGRADSLYVPFFNFDATAGDIKLFMQFSLVAAGTAIIFSIQSKKTRAIGKKLNKLEDWARRITGKKA